ncbi:hypothetical protein [Rhizobium leguminosarum]|uniref:hypothetical protein n=1 Tax=Rhizobium leguminosarum TaxID=384 RepID=UPI001C90CA13|nr:hypothetical protein [Rhizobium leguminosarum]MBY3043149.1 hypothetical protein [Rhizobium leguminosarum]
MDWFGSSDSAHLFRSLLQLETIVGTWEVFLIFHFFISNVGSIGDNLETLAVYIYRMSAHIILLRFFYSGLGRKVGERGFIETRAPFTEYEERCRSRSYSADGHRIEFCEIIHSENGVLADIMRDEGGPPWTHEFLDSAIFRSALEFHAKSSPESMIFNINEMVSSLSQVKVSFASLGNGFYLVSYDPGY